MEGNYSKLGVILIPVLAACLVISACSSNEVVSTDVTDTIEESNSATGDWISPASVRIENEIYTHAYSEEFDSKRIDAWKKLGEIKYSSKEKMDSDYFDEETRDYCSNLEPVGANVYRINENYVAVCDGYFDPKVAIYESAVTLPTDTEKNKYNKISYVKTNSEVFQLIREENYSETTSSKWKEIGTISETDPTPTVCGFSNRDHVPFSSSGEPVGAKVFQIDKNYIAVVDGLSKPKIGIYENLIMR